MVYNQPIAGSKKISITLGPEIMLSYDLFKKIVRNTPLISIDLIVKNDKNKFLLGRRNNSPARGYWFVPGGRILKDETLSVAFSRITLAELSLQIPLEKAIFKGVYQHFYDDNFFDQFFSTHYIVLAYEVECKEFCLSVENEQHNDFRWFTVDELTDSHAVHSYTKDYFL
ncbi:GDP-mannose mannosyl hydrolase [Serratia fonticola]|nr:GDP-mannose mannosyl hydrolase [Serratia fonticola]